MTKINESNKEIENKIEELSRYNITQYLYHCHTNKEKPNKLFMDSVNFREISKKPIEYFFENRPINYVIEESLAKNIISNLPFEAYSEYVTADWINITHRQDESPDFVRTVIAKQNIDLLEKLHDLCVEKIQIDNDFTNNYYRNFLAPLVNISHSLKKHSDYTPYLSLNFVNRYHGLLAKSYSEIQFCYNSQRSFSNQNNNNKLVYQDNSKWFSESINKTDRYNSTIEENHNQLFSILVAQENLFPILEDSVNQVISDLKNNNFSFIENLTIYFGIDIPNKENKNRENKNRENKNRENILSVAFKHNNLKAAQLIINTLKLTEEDCLTAFDLNIQNSIKHLSYQNENLINTIIDSYFNEEYLSLNAKFFPSLKSKTMPLSFLGNNTAFKAEIIKNKETSFQQPLFNNEPYTVHSILCLTKTVDSLFKHIDQLNEGKTDNNIKKRPRMKSKALNCFDFFISDYIIYEHPHIIDDINLKNISNKDWDFIFDKVKNIGDFYDFTGVHNNMHTKYIMSWVQQFQLESKLDDTNKTVKKMKI